MQSRPPRVFISYSHDSPEHKERVMQLSNRLRQDGVDCYMDQYEFSPAEGWPGWCSRQIAEADFVLVVCTETYHQRATGTAPPDSGLGSRWEASIITQAIFEAGSRNEKFIPVLMKEEAKEYVPTFLQSATHYLMTNDEAYDALYRHLTDQPRTPIPPLGSIRELAPVREISPAGATSTDTGTDLESLVLLVTDTGAGMLVPSARIEMGRELTLELIPQDPAASAFLAGFRQPVRPRLALAYDYQALDGDLKDVSMVRERGIERWTFRVSPRAPDPIATFMEPSFEGRSADDIAELRARRILLNETLPKTDDSIPNKVNAAMLEVLVKGLRTPLRALECPFPRIFSVFGSNEKLFLVCCRLHAVLLLKLSRTVERVTQLDLTMQGRTQLKVFFTGRRHRVYQNVEPAVVRVAGVCMLQSEDGSKQ